MSGTRKEFLLGLIIALFNKNHFLCGFIYLFIFISYFIFNIVYCVSDLAKKSSMQNSWAVKAVK